MSALVYVLTFLQGANFVTSQRPNVLLILADDLGYGDLPRFGHPSSYAPNLNDLFDKSKVLTNFYSASPVCSPSRCVIFVSLCIYLDI